MSIEQLWPYIVGGGGIIAGAFAALYRWGARIEATATREELHQLRRDLEAALSEKASRAEVGDHSRALSEHRVELAVVRNELVGIGRAMAELKAMVARLLERHAEGG